MKIRTIARRILLAGGAIAGHFDAQMDMASIVSEREATIAGLRKSLMNVHGERQYWYNLWLTMGREFEATQDAMIGEIDTLRQKCGIKEKKYEQAVRAAFHERFVEPKAHPVPGIKVEVDSVQCPPSPPPEATDGCADKSD